MLVENEYKKLKAFHSIYYRGKSHFEEDGMQMYLVFQPIKRYFKVIPGVGNGSHIYYWKSKELSDERVNYIKTSDYGITLYLSCYKIRVKSKIWWRLFKARPSHTSSWRNSKYSHCL